MPKKIKNVFYKNLTFKKLLDAHYRARKNKAYIYDGDIKGAIELEQVDELVKGRTLITDNSLLERFIQYTDKAVSYQVSDYPLGEILAKLAYEKAVNNEEIDWRKLKPLYIQPPPVFGK